MVQNCPPSLARSISFLDITPIAFCESVQLSCSVNVVASNRMAAPGTRTIAVRSRSLRVKVRRLMRSARTSSQRLPLFGWEPVISFTMAKLRNGDLAEIRERAYPVLNPRAQTAVGDAWRSATLVRFGRAGCTFHRSDVDTT